MPNEKITRIDIRGESYDVGGGDVTGVKGNSESEYRTGNVNITKANIGLGEVRNEDIGSADISAIGATVKDAVVNLDTNKQDKLTNPLTQSDVKDNLTSTSTTAPLSANQGKILKEYAAQLGIDTDYLASHSVTLSGDFTFSDLENSKRPVFFTNWEDATNFPGAGGSGIFVPMLDERCKLILYVTIANDFQIRVSSPDGWKSWVRISSSDNIADNLNTYSISALSAKQGYILSRDVPWYGTSSTAASTIAKTATTSDGKFVLTTGAKVSIKFTYNNTALAPTLNVDSTGAKSIKAYGTTAPTSWWQAGDVVTFTYDGTNWIMGATEGQISQINSDFSIFKNFKSISSTYTFSDLVNDVVANKVVFFHNWAQDITNFPQAYGTGIALRSIDSNYISFLLFNMVHGNLYNGIYTINTSTLKWYDITHTPINF